MAFTNAIIRAAGFVFLITVIVSPGEGLKCYRCNSDIDQSCESSPRAPGECDNLPQLKDVGAGLFEIKPVCLKSIVKDTSSGRRVVLRDCVVDMSVLKTCDVANALKLPEAAAIEVCETCNTDLCNGGNQLLLSTALFLLPCIILLIQSLM